MATKSEIFRTAHEVARREMKADAKFYGNSYAKAFAEALRAIYATEKYEADCDRKYGKGMRPGFQVVEPSHVWA